MKSKLLFICKDKNGVDKHAKKRHEQAKNGVKRGLWQFFTPL